MLKQDGIYRHLCQNIGENRSEFQVNSGHHFYNYSQAKYGILLNGSVFSIGGDTGKCLEQESKLGLAFTAGLVTMGLLSFPLGWIFDLFGLWLIRCVAW